MKLGIRVLIGLGLAVAAICPSVPARAQEDVVAFGDSITEGPFPFDEDDIGGYPKRLQQYLRDAGMTGVVVFNEGKSSEKTAEGLTRIDSVLDKHAKRAAVVVIMEGTNDVSKIAEGLLSIETTVSNLEAIAAKVRARAIDPLYSSIIPRPPWAKRDSANFITYDLVLRLRDLTSTGNRVMAFVYEVFKSMAPSVYDTHYFFKDVVGHPNATGFQLLAEIFGDQILRQDHLAPTASWFFKTGRAGILDPGDEIRGAMHESGTGIRKSDTYFTLNGRSVSTDVEGNQRRVELSYRVTNADLECAGRITMRSEDGAEPPNIRNQIVAEFSVADARRLASDVNGDCRVDGFDLTLLGVAFGARRGEVDYSSFTDITNDGRVDGDDLAKLAKNFGKKSS